MDRDIKEIKLKTMELERKIIKLSDKVDTLHRRVVTTRDGANITCLNCGYSWLTRTKLDKVSCSKCGKKVEV